MPNIDIAIKIYADIEGEDINISKIETNAKDEALEDLLSTWLQMQMGKGEDNSPREECSQYQVMIELDLSDDSFYTKSNTGNKGLTTGIVMLAMRNLDSANIKPFPPADDGS